MTRNAKELKAVYRYMVVPGTRYQGTRSYYLLTRYQVPGTGEQLSMVRSLRRSTVLLSYRYFAVSQLLKVIHD